MATARSTTRKAPASKSGNPATRAAVAKIQAEQEAEDAARQEAAAAHVRARFASLELPAPVFDEDGYEVIPDLSNEEGGSYKFKVRGQAFTLPKLQYLPLSVAKKLQEAKTEAEAQSLIFERYVPELLEYAGADELMHVMKRWTD
jgi:hypothetical protein